MIRVLAGGLALLCALVWSGDARAGAVRAHEVRLALEDGRELVGLLFEEGDDLVVVRDGEATTVARSEVLELVVLAFDRPLSTEPAVAGAPVSTGDGPFGDPDAVPGEELASIDPEAHVRPELPSEALARVEDQLDPDALVAYAEGRIELRDRRRRLIGPLSLGFPARDVGRDGRRDFSAWSGGSALGADHFFARVDDPVATGWWRQRKESGQARVAVSLGIAGAGTTLMAIVAGIAAEAERRGVQPGDAEVISLPPLWGTGLVLTITGTALGTVAVRRVAQNHDRHLEELMDRERAWELAEEHNRRLRLELGLPDEEALDSPASPVVQEDGP